ncbi:MAG: hypothetical protein ACREON_16720 [Gemmatimonadaceae bacterium]
MPRVLIEALPDDARAWVFASDRPLAGPDAARVLEEVDRFLDTWQAHGAPLTCARDWRDDRFLIVAVDQRAAGASGCSIDGLFRVFKALEPAGVKMLTRGQVFFRGAAGDVISVSRGEFGQRAARGEITGGTHVFDTSLGTLGELRGRFETEAVRSWHAQLAPELAPARH